MLEHACLIVHGWTRDEEASLWIRRITDRGGASLGIAQSAGSRGPWWLGWLRSLRIDVCETDDISHLMTLTRTWALSRIWQVHDAEDIHVGTLYLNTLVTSQRTLIGEMALRAGGGGTITGPSRQVLASHARRADRSLEVTFAEETRANPFLRMMLLGSILSLEAPR